MRWLLDGSVVLDSRRVVRTNQSPRLPILPQGDQPIASPHLGPKESFPHLRAALAARMISEIGAGVDKIL